MAKKTAQRTSAAKAAAAERVELNPLLALDPVSEPRYEKGSQRPFLVTEVPETVTESRSISQKEWPLLAVLMAAGAYIRFSKISIPNSVVFDEVHFGGFAKKYILGKFFMDVHPPLAKMLFAAVASLGGFDGSFDFAKIGDEYPDHVPYELMRYFSAGLGLLTVLLCFLTLRASGARPLVAFITAACLLFENSYITISRYILLDSPLIFFIASAVYAFKKFEVQQPFSFGWWRALMSCAISLGLALSSKWVGLFTVAWAGVLCVVHMWLLIGDLNVKSSVVFKNAIARASVLIGVPVVLYLAIFSVHFQMLSNDGDGSSFMSSAFRMGLNGSKVPKSTSAPVGYGSVITIRHLNTRGGYLHSHRHNYPEGSKQQQITLYPHLDINNDWIIEPYNFTTPDYFMQIKNGDKVRLRHVVTGLRLHSHDEKPPVSSRDWQKEASCYGFDGFAGDANDDWVVSIIQHASTGKGKEELRAIESKFKLIHAMTGYTLFAGSSKLPEKWGFGQQEVTTASQGARRLSHWYIETNTNAKYNGTEEISYPKMSFFQKVIESHKVMWSINNGLTSSHNWQSSPHEWPLLMRGISYWSKHHTQVYFIGNPAVWWTASACLVGFMVHVAISLLKWQTGSAVCIRKASFNYNYQMFTYFVGWAIHYFPFFIMGRQLFLHHYLPAQYFAILGIGHFFDLLVTSSQRYSKHAYLVLILFLTATVVMYNSVSPLISGTIWTKPKCYSSKIISGWDYNCESFFEMEKDYTYYFRTAKAGEVEPTTSTSVENEAKQTPESFAFVPQEIEQSNSPLQEPPAPEYHDGEWPFPENQIPEQIPQGEIYDDATSGKDVKNAQDVSLPETVDDLESQEEPVADLESQEEPVANLESQEQPVAEAEPKLEDQ